MVVMASSMFHIPHPSLLMYHCILRLTKTVCYAYYETLRKSKISILSCCFKIVFVLALKNGDSLMIKNVGKMFVSNNIISLHCIVSMMYLFKKEMR